MNRMEKLANTICNQNGLQEKLVTMWKENLPTDEILKALKTANMDVTYEELEKLLEHMSKEEAKSIAKRELNEDDLEKVSGGFHWCLLGISGQSCDKYMSSCDKHFKYYAVDEPCLANYWCDQVNVDDYSCFKNRNNQQDGTVIDD